MKKNNSIGFRTTWAEVDLSCLDFNFKQVRRVTQGKSGIMAVIKCDAYGHGMLPIAERLIRLGVDYFGVASLDEAVILRKNKVKTPILVLGNVSAPDAGAVVDFALTQTVSGYELAGKLNQAAGKKGKSARVHIKVDTGMGRLGILYKHAFAFIKQAVRMKHLRVEGMFTHFPCADSDPGFTNHQISIFNKLVNDLKKAGIQIPLLHTANSMGIIGYPRSHFNLVRPGLMLYGIHPKPGLNIRLKPVLALKSRIIYLKRIPRGQGISYGRTYFTKRESSIAVFPIGYGDGYPRNLSNRAEVLIRGRRFRISGTVCMDQIMVDLGDLSVKTGNEAVLIGRQGKESISAEELSRLSRTIPYEIVCGIGSRVARLYIN
ncbi:alanine racemase [Candidatus Omnitrophota bacterium]